MLCQASMLQQSLRLMASKLVLYSMTPISNHGNCLRSATCLPLIGDNGDVQASVGRVQHGDNSNNDNYRNSVGTNHELEKVPDCSVFGCHGDAHVKQHQDGDPDGEDPPKALHFSRENSRHCSIIRLLHDLPIAWLRHAGRDLCALQKQSLLAAMKLPKINIILYA